MDNTTYAPRSPDLSSFFASPAKTQQPYHPQINQQPPNSSSSYHPQSPTIPSYNSPAIPAPTSTYNHNPHTSQQDLYSQPPQPFTSSYGTQSHTSHNFENRHPSHSSYDQFDASNTQYQIPDLPSQHSFSKHRESQNYYAPPPQTYSESPQTYHDPTQPAYLHSEESNYPTTLRDNSYITSPILQSTQTSTTMSRRGVKQPPMEQSTFQAEFQQAPPQPQLQLKDPNPTNIQISTKFPTARIKRIMQADEEVGKVAQVTPPAVNKALELFMIALVTGAADKAKEKGGKRITAQHLKQVVLGDEQFDFLAEIVGRVEEGKEEGAGRKRKTKKEEGSESSDEAGEKKKKGKGGRKKKGSDE